MQEYIKKSWALGIRIITSNDEVNDIIKIAKSLEDSGLLWKGVTETVQNEVKEQKGGFLSMLLGTLGASLLGNILTGPGVNRVGKGRGINRAGEGVIRAGYGSRFSEKKERKIFNAASPFN